MLFQAGGRFRGPFDYALRLAQMATDGGGEAVSGLAGRHTEALEHVHLRHRAGNLQADCESSNI